MRSLISKKVDLLNVHYSLLPTPYSRFPIHLLSFQLLSPETQPASRQVNPWKTPFPPGCVRSCPFQPFLPDHPPEQGLHLRMQQDHPAPPPDRNDSRGLNPPAIPDNYSRSEETQRYNQKTC